MITQTAFETSNIKGSGTFSISCYLCKCSSSSSDSATTTTTTTTTTIISSSSSSTAVVAVTVVILAVVAVVIYSNYILFIYLLKADTFCINTPAFIIFYFP